MHSNRLNSITATQTDLSWTCHRLCCKHLNISRSFLSAIFTIYVHDFHRNFTIS